MGHVTAEVQALLQDRRSFKAELDASRRDVQFVAGGEVLFDNEHTPLTPAAAESRPSRCQGGQGGGASEVAGQALDI